MLYIHSFPQHNSSHTQKQDPTPLTHFLPTPPPPFSAETTTVSSMSNPNIKTFDWAFNPEPEDEPLQLKGHKILFFITIFTIIILFTALFLCARWLFNTHNTPHAPSHTSTFSSQSQGLDADAIKKLPIILHQANTSNHALEETECCICLSTFRDGEKVKVLPGCDHYFHCECVDAWLVNHSSCPLCRASLKIDLEFPKILIQEPPIRYNLPL